MAKVVNQCADQAQSVDGCGGGSFIDHSGSPLILSEGIRLGSHFDFLSAILSITYIYAPRVDRFRKSMTDLARFPVRKGTLPKLLLEVGRAERCVSYILGCLDFLFQPYGSKDQVRRAPVCECALQDHGAHEGDQDKPNSILLQYAMAANTRIKTPRTMSLPFSRYMMTSFSSIRSVLLATKSVDEDNHAEDDQRRFKERYLDRQVENLGCQ